MRVIDQRFTHKRLFIKNIRIIKYVNQKLKNNNFLSESYLNDLNKKNERFRN